MSSRTSSFSKRPRSSSSVSRKGPPPPLANLNKPASLPPTPPDTPPVSVLEGEADWPSPLPVSPFSQALMQSFPLPPPVSSASSSASGGTPVKRKKKKRGESSSRPSSRDSSRLKSSSSGRPRSKDGPNGKTPSPPPRLNVAPPVSNGYSSATTSRDQLVSPAASIPPSSDTEGEEDWQSALEEFIDEDELDEVHLLEPSPSGGNAPSPEDGNSTYDSPREPTPVAEPALDEMKDTISPLPTATGTISASNSPASSQSSSTPSAFSQLSSTTAATTVVGGDEESTPTSPPRAASFPSTMENGISPLHARKLSNTNRGSAPGTLSSRFVQWQQNLATVPDERVAPTADQEKESNPPGPAKSAPPVSHSHSDSHHGLGRELLSDNKDRKLQFQRSAELLTGKRPNENRDSVMQRKASDPSLDRPYTPERTISISGYPRPSSHTGSPAARRFSSARYSSSSSASRFSTINNNRDSFDFVPRRLVLTPNRASRTPLTSRRVSDPGERISLSRTPSDATVDGFKRSSERSDQEEVISNSSVRGAGELLSSPSPPPQQTSPRASPPLVHESSPPPETPAKPPTQRPPRGSSLPAEKRLIDALDEHWSRSPPESVASLARPQAKSTSSSPERSRKRVTTIAQVPDWDVHEQKIVAWPPPQMSPNNTPPPPLRTQRSSEKLQRRAKSSLDLRAEVVEIGAMPSSPASTAPSSNTTKKRRSRLSHLSPSPTSAGPFPACGSLADMSEAETVVTPPEPQASQPLQKKTRRKSFLSKLRPKSTLLSPRNSQTLTPPSHSFGEG